jgi:hypothetical protein
MEPDETGVPLSELDIARIFADPFYCVTVHPINAIEHEYLVSEELWIRIAAKSIEEEGAEAFLRHLLENLKGNRPNLT